MTPVILTRSFFGRPPETGVAGALAMTGASDGGAPDGDAVRLSLGVVELGVHARIATSERERLMARAYSATILRGYPSREPYRSGRARGPGEMVRKCLE